MQTDSPDWFPSGPLGDKWSPLGDPTEASLDTTTYAADMAREMGAQTLPHQFADALPHITWMSAATGTILFYNRRFFEYTGVPDAETGPQTLEEKLHPSDRAFFQQTWEDALRAGSPWQCEFRLQSKEAQYRWFLGRSDLIRDDTGYGAAWVGTATDIEYSKAARAREQDTQQRAHFLDSLIEQMRQEGDVNATIWKMEEAVGTFLGLSRYLYAHIEHDPSRPNGGYSVIHRDFCQPGVASVVGTWPLAGWEAINSELAAGRTVVAHDLDSDANNDWAPAHRAMNVRAVVVVPLFRGDKWVAVFAAQQADARRWSQEEVQLLETIAARAWIVIEQARLREQEQEIARKDKRIAEILQRSLLVAVRPDRFAGLEIATCYETAWDEALVGGDFYDVFSSDNDHVCFVVGDVAGKGLEAAARTAEVRFSLRAFLHDAPDASRALSQLNRLLCERGGPQERGDDFAGQPFVSLALAVLNVKTGELETVCGGAESPLIFRVQGRQCENAAQGGILAGIRPNASYTARTCFLDAGDTLVFCTDGITEARNRDRSFFGAEGLERTLVESLPAASPSDAAASVIANAKAWSGERLRDDVCLLVATYKGRRLAEATP